MIRHRFPFMLFVALLGLWSMPSVSSGFDPASNRRPLTGFMKSFADTADAVQKTESQYDSSFDQAGVTTGDLTTKAAAGQAFYDACKERFEKMHGEAGKILAEVPAGFPATKLQQASFDLPTPNHRVNRSLVRCFALVALHHFASGDCERAVHTQLLSNWFGHSLARGMGEVPTLIDLMISIAIRKIACGEILWSSLAKGKFTPARLEEMAKALTALEASQPSFVDSMEWELMGTLNATRRAIQDSTSNEMMAKLFKELPLENRDRILAPAMEFLQGVNERILNMASVYRMNPKKMQNAMRTYVEKLQESGRFRLSDYLNPGGKVGQILAGIMIPNFAKAYDQYLTARYREKGTVLLMRFLARLGNDAALPKTPAELETVLQSRLPADIFAEPRSPCRYALDADWMTVYSVGPDQKDDRGHNTDDCLLFKVPVRFLKR